MKFVQFNYVTATQNNIYFHIRLKEGSNLFFTAIAIRREEYVDCQ